MTMGDCLRTNKLIILRGNSGSGKTTIANNVINLKAEDIYSEMD